MKAVCYSGCAVRVAIDGDIVGEIEQGLLIYLGVAADDGPDQVAWLVDKIANLRMFDDLRPKDDVQCQRRQRAALVISQFTLLADARKGRRPSFFRRLHRKERGTLWRLC